MLDPFFDPNVIAIFGARPEPGHVGYALMKNLQGGRGRSLYPITDAYEEVLGVPAKRSIEEVEGAVDLAVIAIKASAVPEALRACARKGVQAVVVISAGFKEVGPDGKALEEELTRIARESGMALLGPNCLGVIDAHADMNASFVVEKPLPGRISVLSQSGAIGTALLDWASDAGVGVAKFVSLGNEAGTSEVEFLEYLGNDSATDAILVYLEHVSDGPRFLSVASRITREFGKPIVVLRAGRSARGSAAVRSHTGSLAPEDAVFGAACRQAGIVTVSSLRELFDIAKLFALGIRAPHLRLAIVTNGGGPSVNAADLIELSHSLELVAFDESTKDALRAVLPPMAAVGDPVDVIGDAGEKRYRDTLGIVSALPNVDAILTLVTPQMMTDFGPIARAIVDARRTKPIIPVLMGGSATREGLTVLRDAGMVNFDLPPDAIAALDAIGGGVRKERPTPVKSVASAPSAEMLGFSEAKDLLSAYGIAAVGEFILERSGIAEAFGRLGSRAAAMKVVSRDVVHKTESGAVRLDIHSGEEAERVWDEMVARIREGKPDAAISGMVIQPMVRGKEVIVGMKRDAIFGPVVVVGLGGIFVELLRDVAMRVAPIEKDEAMKMLEEISGAKYLKEYRGEPAVNRERIAEIVAAISRLSIDHPEIAEIDLNPLVATATDVFVVDARVMRRAL
jgi:acetyltransferase